MGRDELSYWLVINRLPGLGPSRLEALLQQEKSLSNCFNESEPTSEFIAWCRHQRITKIALDWKGVEKDLAWATQQDCHLLTWQDAAYPPLLKQIPSKPPVLYVQGDLLALATTQIALVGSRHPTPEGKDNAYQFAFELAKQGVSITSGLALGIDAASHEGALDAQGITLAVLGNSLDQIYPTKHIGLANKIKQRGALLSEFPLGTPPKAAHFPQRNRIISGMSLGVLVVESAMKSGSLITANYAVEQGREIYALPGSIHNPLAKGCNHLIRQGAKCVESVAHILEELPNQSWPKTTLIKSTPKQPNPVQKSLFEFEEEIHPLLAHIERTCTPVDVIIQRAGLTPQELSSMLLGLELQGDIISVPGGYIRVRPMENYERKRN